MDTRTLTIDAPTTDRETADIGIICGTCMETLAPGGTCLNVGACVDADRAAVRGSLRRGAASAARPSAWTISGRVD